jgi:hypothetical protein
MSNKPNSDIKIIDISKEKDNGISDTESEIDTPISVAESDNDSELSLGSKSDGASDFPVDTSSDESSSDEDEMPLSSMVAGGKKPSGDSSDSGSDTSSDSSSDCDTAEILAADPLFFVLSRLLVNDKGENITTVLTNINHNLKKIHKAISKSK